MVCRHEGARRDAEVGADVQGTVTQLCRDCRREFTLSADHAQWFDSQGFERPKRCEDCRRLRKARKDAAASADGTPPHRRGMEIR
jgi:hypothetical protein